MTSLELHGNEARGSPALEMMNSVYVLVPPSVKFDTTNAPVRVFIDKLRLPARPELHEVKTRKTTIRLAHAATSRIKEVTIICGTSQTDRIIQDDVEVYPVAEITDLIQSQILDLPDIALEVSEELQSNNPRLCEAVLRSVFAPRAPGESLDDCMLSAEIVKQAFTLQASVYAKAEIRALKVAQYRRAELQLKLQYLQKDEDPLVPPDQFEDPVVYQSWKMEELEILSNLVDLFGNLPSFSGGMQVRIISGEGLKTDVPPKCSPPVFKKKVVETRVYCSVTILRARPGTMPSPVESEDGNLERTPAFFSDVVSCTGDAEWNTQSPGFLSAGPSTFLDLNLTICGPSMDRILIEVWEKSDNAVKAEADPQSELVTETPMKLSSFRGIFKRQNTVRKKKIAPWSGDKFLGQVIVSFSHVESQALSHGGVQGQSPATSYMLADERGKHGLSTIQLQFTCSCERFYRDAPPNKLLLMPPIEDIEIAFDNFVRLAFHAENEALFQLGPQWRLLVYGFGAHYRVREERCALGMVNVMVGLLQEDARYCIGIVPEWLPVCSAAKDGTLTKSELALHCHIVVSLMKPVVNALENFQTVFPGNKPRGGIPRLIELLGLILRWEPDPAEILIPLQSFVQNSCERRLQKHLFRDTDDGELKELSALALFTAVQLVRSDIVEHSTTYVEAFPDGLNLPQLTAPMYYRLICHYVSTFMSESPSATFTRDHRELVKEFILFRGDLDKHGIQVEYFDIESLFGTFLKEWLGSLGPRMIDWVTLTVSKETWEPLSFQPMVSSSFADLYGMIGQVVDEVTIRLLPSPSNHEVICKMTDAICSCIQAYIDALERQCLEEISKEMDEGSGKQFFDSCSKSLFSRLNNIGAVQGEQKNLKRTLVMKWQSHASRNAQKEIEKGELHLQDGLSIAAAENGLYMLKPLYIAIVAMESPGLSRDYEIASASERTIRRLRASSEHETIDDKIDEKFVTLEMSVQEVLREVVEAILESIQSQFESQLHHLLLKEKAANGEWCIVEQKHRFIDSLDHCVLLMSTSLQPKLLQQFLIDIPGALLWCMEGYELSLDAGCSGPVTKMQCRNIEKILNVLIEHFGGHKNHDTFVFSTEGCARLRKILACRAMESHELCARYWQASNTFQRFGDVEPGSILPRSNLNCHSTDEVHNLDNGNQAHSQEIGSMLSANGLNMDGTATDVQLHVLDYISLLEYKDDEKARELVATQSSSVKLKYLQVELGVRMEEFVATYSCRLSRIIPGLLYITAKRICFIKWPGVSSKKWSSSFLTLDNIQQIKMAGNDTLVFMPMHKQSIIVSRVSNLGAAVGVIYQQVAGTGTDLEKSIALILPQNQT